MTPAVSLRPVGTDDAEFVYRVYAHTRYDELVPAGWPLAQVEAFLRMQFHAQTHHYRTHYPAATHDVILVDGIPAGRLYVDRGPDELRIVDIAILPDFRGRGIGTYLLTGLLAEGTATDRLVGIAVEGNNPAQTLYRRLGFVRTGTTGVYDLMEWRPAPADAGRS